MWTFSGVFPAVVALWTVAAISAAAADKSWLALGVALFYGPIGNLFLAVVGACYLGVRRANRPDFSWGPPAMLLVATTLASTFAIFVATCMMDLHGC